MKRFEMSIRKRILFTVLGVGLITYVLSLGFLTYRDAENSLRTALQSGRVQVVEYATQLSSDLNIALTLARNLAATMQGVTSETWESREREFDRLARKVIHAGYNYSEIWATFDYKLPNPDYPYSEGQTEVLYPFNDTLLHRQWTLRDTSGLATNLFYIAHRNLNEEEMLEPFLLRSDSVGSVNYVVGVSIPVRDSADNPVGLITINRSTDYYRNRFAEYHPYNNMSLYLFSGEMKIIAGADAELVGQNAEDILTQIPRFTDKTLLMRQGTLLAESYISPMTRQESFLFSAPVTVGDVRRPWTLCMIISRDSLLAYSDTTMHLTILVAIAGLVLLFIVLLWLASRIGGPLSSISKTLLAIANGRIDSNLHLKYKTGDEIESIATSVNKLLDNMEAKVAFAQAIGAGDQEKEFEAADGDVLGQSLLEMQQSLRAAKKREIQQREQEEQQAWAAQGMALFSEYLRVETNDIVGFTYDILHHLAQYVSADIGAVYLVEKDQEQKDILALTSAYAYQVRKYTSARFAIGEGLVGRCAMEQKRIYLTDIPKGYVKISSGLGYDAPNALVLVPIMMNDVLQGVIELARFGLFEEYVLRFIESVMGSFAATLVALRNNIQTQRLLQEARIRSEEISSQEEEMRQNMEELQTIQEEVARKSAELESWNRAMQSACCVVEYDTRGYLLYANNEYLSLLRMSLAEIQNHHHTEGMEMRADQARTYHNFWQDLLHGQVKRNIRNRIKRNGQILTFTETYAPILNERNEVVKILKIAFNISEFLTDAPQSDSAEKLSFETE